ncbi:hypothetical protein P754_gp28 [Propionibacterium phage PHL114L00]|uniref:Uncharacterized protein n=2 Tax=Pahexavirus PHL114L00 TaxID=1982287 RepID=T1R5Z6_9CAUD|nr:hypothetical protein P754_gp28 [Propionibacterium phage PHL114L00]AGI12839.1 hypothetical protein PHL114L00_28 [Propionibacterium phage PHL114L00]AII29381.1 hypothetical protein PHL114N00_28 [Propionibacterium phage PHL114N00]
MSISFKPTTRNRQAIRDIIAQELPNSDTDVIDDTLNNIIEYCWNTFTDSNRYAVAAQYWRGQNPPDQQHQRILVGYYKTLKQAENAAKQFHWNTRLQQQWKTWILPVHNGTVSEHFTNQKTLFDTQTSNQDDGALPEHLRDVMCGKTIHHQDGATTWCTRKPGHDGDCRTGWQPATQPMGYHGNQN